MKNHKKFLWYKLNPSLKKKRRVSSKSSKKNSACIKFEMKKINSIKFLNLTKIMLNFSARRKCCWRQSNISKKSTNKKRKKLSKKFFKWRANSKLSLTKLKRKTKNVFFLSKSTSNYAKQSSTNNYLLLNNLSTNNRNKFKMKKTNYRIINSVIVTYSKIIYLVK